MTAERVKESIDRLVKIGLVLIVVLAPTQYGFEIKGKYLSIADPVIWATFLAWSAGVLLTKSFSAMAKPSLFGTMFVLVTLTSLARAADRFEAVQEAVQYGEYFVAVFLLFADSLRDERSLRRVVGLICGVAGVVVLLGVADYARSSIDAANVSALFGTRSVFGGFLSLCLPLAFGLMLYEPRILGRACYLLLILVGAMVCLSGPAFLSIALALGVIAAVRGSRTLLALLAITAIVVAFVLPALPRDNVYELHSSMSLCDDTGRVNDRYIEWQAAFDMWQENPVLGVGAGNYQESIGMYYGFLPHSNEPVKEADLHNVYLVLLSSTGLFGMLMFAGMLVQGAARAGLMHWRATPSFLKGLALGLLGSIVAFALNCVWCGLLVRGTGVMLAIMLGLVVAVEQAGGDAAESK